MKQAPNKLIDFINGELIAEEELLLEKELQTSTVLQEELDDLLALQELVGELPLLDTPKDLDLQLDQMLQQHKIKETPVRVRFVTKYWQQVAAVIALIGIGILIGLQLNRQDEQLAAIQQNLQETKLEMLQLVNEGPTSSRIRAVNVSLDALETDGEVIEILINLLLKDESTNVRLSALEALEQLDQSEQVKHAFIQALQQEKKSIVQINLIHALVRLKEMQALPLFENIIENDNHSEQVKDEARFGKIKML